MLKNQAGELVSVEWEDALIYVAKRLRYFPGSEMAAVAGALCDAESLIALKDLMNRLGSETVCTEQSFPLGAVGTDFRSNYIMNSTIAGNSTSFSTRTPCECH